jgi:shikimate dehydrogenase
VAAYELAEMGCSLTIGSRTLSTAEGLAEEITSRFPHLEIAALPWVNLSQGTYDVVVNATPVGMGAPQGERPINLEDLKGVTCVYDLIYNPPQTRLLRQGQELGLKVLNGLPMLVFQAAAAQEFWLGRPVPEEAIWQVLASLQELKGNG